MPIRDTPEKPYLVKVEGGLVERLSQSAINSYFRPTEKGLITPSAGKQGWRMAQLAPSAYALVFFERVSMTTSPEKSLKKPASNTLAY
jgi:hypothetical protein